MVHDVPIGEIKVNYAREKIDISDNKTVKKLISIMKQAYKEYLREYESIVSRTDIDAPTKLRLLRQNQYQFDKQKCLRDCGIDDNQKLPFKYETYQGQYSNYIKLPEHNCLNNKSDLFILDNKGYSTNTYEDICVFLGTHAFTLKDEFPMGYLKSISVFGHYKVSFCDSAGLYWHINSDTSQVVKIEDVLKYLPDDTDNTPDTAPNRIEVKERIIFDMNNKFAAIELQNLPDNTDTHVINDSSNDYLDLLYDFVLPAYNKKVIVSTQDNDELDWILQNKTNVSYFTKADMNPKKDTVAKIIEPLLKNDNAMYVVHMLTKNKQLSNNIALLHLNTTQDTKAYIKALYNASRKYKPTSHNLSFDQKLFIDAIRAKGDKILGKKDAAKIVKRLKLLFPDELKLIKDTADEIVHKVQL